MLHFVQECGIEIKIILQTWKVQIGPLYVETRHIDFISINGRINYLF